MMERLEAPYPVYPLFCLISAASVFFIGLVLVAHAGFPLFLAGIALLYLLFGYGQTVLMALFVFVPLAAMSGLFGLTFATPEQALQVAYRVLLLGLSAVPTISLPPVLLVRNLNQIRCPRWLTIGVLVCIRFMKVLAVEVGHVRMAMRTRGMDSSIFRPSVMYRALVVPFMMRLMSLTDMMSLSLETRAFTMHGLGATQYKRVCVTGRDLLYAGLTAGWLAGWLLIHLIPDGWRWTV